MKKYFILISTLIFLDACVKDKPQNAIQPQVQLSNARKVYIINEGGLGYGNSSVSLFDPGTNEVIEDFYKTQNGLTLGDVTQSLSYINGNYYIVVNNSGKIIVCDNQFKKTGQINLTSPRYILPITNQKAYVSDFKLNSVSIIDLNSNLKSGTIPCKGWTEKMVLIYNKAFITNMRSNYMYVINTINDQMTDSVFVGPNAGNVVIDKNDKLWVLGTGDVTNSISGRLSRINPLTNQVELNLTFGNSDAPGYLCLNKTRDTLYYINNSIYRMPISDNALATNALILNGTKNFYGMRVNPNDYSIYAADALDYSQRSNIYIFDSKGNQKNVFKAGINANGFYFE